MSREADVRAASRPAARRTAPLTAAARLAAATLRSLPAAGGIMLSCYGLWLAWPPLGFIGAGAFLLLMDRKVP